MQNEELPPYNFKFQGGQDNVYSFDTKNTVAYLVRFKPNADYVALSEAWRDEFFELVMK